MADNSGRIPAHQIAVGAPPLAGPVNNSHPLTETAPARAKVPPQAPPAAEPKDSLREVVETVVFVVVLVLLLKSFVAEAFVIPTGSMAETLYGYQKWVTCPKCTFPFPVNCSSEVDPQGEPATPVVGCTCPNCRYQIDFAQEKEFGDESRWPKWQTGDRVLVGKYFYDLGVEGLNSPQRYQVVVFKYPKQPQKDYTPLNYIKRMIGLPGETIAIHYGNLYRFAGLNYDEQDSGVPPDDLWKDDYMHKDDAAALRLFEQGKFEILRKGSKQVLAERRIVYDNDHQATDLKNKIDSRWQSARETKEAWQLNDVAEPTVFTHASRQGPETAWLHYEHLMPDGNRSHARPELITDFMGYNSYEKKGQQRNAPPGNWVGDLMLECDVTIQQPQGQLIFDLSKGVDRFQARFDLASGQCSLIRITNEREQELDSKPTAITRAGKHRIRFANVDERLLVWVDNALPFGEGVNYPAPNVRGPTLDDLKPARIGVKSGGVTVSGIKLWRDTYYTANVEPARQPDHGGERVDFGQNSTWGPLEHLPVLTMYVQPNHFLCLGDNSPESSDGRSWGTVPKRLMLGRALLIYYPFIFGPNRAGRIE